MGCRACNKIYSPLLFRPSQPLGKLLALHLDQASFGGSPLGRPTVLPSTSPILAWRRPRTGSPILPTTHTHTQRPRHTAVQPLPGHSAGRPWLPARRAHTPDVHALDLTTPVNGPDAIPHGLSALCGRELPAPAAQRRIGRGRPRGSASEPAHGSGRVPSAGVCLAPAGSIRPRGRRAHRDCGGQGIHPARPRPHSHAAQANAGRPPCSR